MMFPLAIFFVCVSAALGGVVKPRGSASEIESRIVGGVPVHINDYPYQLSVEYNYAHICGAAIIGSKYALTSAHCVSGIQAIKLSIRTKSSYAISGTGQVIPVLKYVPHPNYDATTNDYDIAILELYAAIHLGEGAQPIALPELNQQITPGSISIVTGWGKLSEGGSSPLQLHAVAVPIVSQRDCKRSFGERVITDRMICAGYTNGGKDACQGDNGGPLYHVDTGKLVGIVSWGLGCGRPNYPGVYASIPNLRNFIKSNTGI